MYGNEETMQGLPNERKERYQTTDELPELCRREGACGKCTGLLNPKGEDGNRTDIPCPLHAEYKLAEWKRLIPPKAAALIDKPFIIPDWATPDEVKHVKSALVKIGKARTYWEDDPTMGFGLVGKVGTGKTHLAMHFLQAFAEEVGIEWIKKQTIYSTTLHFPLVVSEHRFLRAFTAVSRGEASEKDQYIYHGVYKAKALYIDDLGGSRITPARRDELSHLIIDLHEREATLFYTSNLPPTGEDSLESRGILDPRAIDRLALMAFPVPTDGFPQWRARQEKTKQERYGRAEARGRREN